MSEPYTPNLIRARNQPHLTALICLLIFIVGSQTTSAQQQIAQDAYTILEQSCFICHGPTGSYRETLLIEYNALIQNGTVVPGNPDASELYNRLITTDIAKRMPLAQPPLSTQAIDTVRNWILADAPDWTAIPTTGPQFIAPSEILNTVETHLMSLSSFDRTFARYFTMTHLYNAGESARILQEYRKGLYKLVNSLSWGSKVTNPEPIDPQNTIFYIDLRHYEWDVNNAWTQIETEYPYHISFDAPEQTALKEQLTRLQTEMQADIPAIHVDWFIAHASLPPLYHDLLSLPLTDRELETRLEVDVLRNLQNAPGVRVWRAGTNNSGVSANNRVLERHISRYGAYWKSYDFAGNVGTQNVFTHPLSFTHDGGEVIFNLPNGLQGYYITNAASSRLDAAPINIVSNPAASDPTVRTGLSCFGCHTKGLNTFEDEVRAVIESDSTPAYDKEQALRLYVEKSEMDALVQEDMDRYSQALQATGGAVDDIEPIQRFHEVFQGPVDAVYAAAVVGLETAVLLEKIGENAGLQNAGLLVLASPNGSVKRDTWTSNFRDIVFALDFPELVDKPPVVQDPGKPPGALVHIPDPHLRAVIAEVLGKSPNTPITVEDMERLRHLDVEAREIRDLTGLQFASNLESLFLNDNQVSDLSPIAGLINLKIISFINSPVSDLSPLRGLRNLTVISGTRSKVVDLSPIAGLTQLENIDIDFIDSPIPVIHDTKQLSRLVNLTFLALDGADDLTPLAGLTKLERLFVSDSNIRDLKPLAGLTNLTHIHMGGTSASDLSPLAKLTKLKHLYLPGRGDDLSDLTPLAGLTGLEELYLHHNDLSDISPIATLTGLRRLGLSDTGISDISVLAALHELEWADLSDNEISDVSPIVNLTNLTWLSVSNNNISDLSPLEELRQNITLFWFNNPGIPTEAPKIEGPWLWVVLPDTELDSNRDLLSEATGGIATEMEIAAHGAVQGSRVGADVWTYRRLPPTGSWNIQDMLQRAVPDGIIYGSISLHSPREQETTMYVGSDDALKVWLNGILIYESIRHHGADDYTDFFPVTLQAGRNVLLVAVGTRNGFFGFEPGTEYTVLTPSIGYTFSKTPIHTGETFTLDISAEDILDLAGWQFDIAFDPAILEAVNVSEGDFLKTDGGSTFFQSGSIDNAAGKIRGLSSARLSTQGGTGTGTLLEIRFKAKSEGETAVTLQNVQFGTSAGDSMPAGPREIRIVVAQRLATGDVNRDGVVSILDLILIAQQLGRRVPAGSAVDLNGDGIVSILDLILTARNLGSTTASAAPPNPPAPLSGGEGRVDPAMIEAWIAQARLEDDGSLAFKQGIEMLENLLALLIPEETFLLPNYPNPFNPETWIPYQLAEPAEVTLTIYDMNGGIVRRLAIGHQAAGIYRSRTRAAYWDGRNQLGEPVASGLYFYTLTTDDFIGTRKMMILK